MDDLITTCKNTEIAESITTWLLSEFDELKITTRGEIHKFTGMVFDFKSPRKLKITMCPYHRQKKIEKEEEEKKRIINGSDEY